MIVKDCYATFFLHDGSRVELFKGGPRREFDGYGFDITKPKTPPRYHPAHGIDTLRDWLNGCAFIDIGSRIQRVSEIDAITFVETEREVQEPKGT